MSDLISRRAALDIFDDYNVSVENGELEAYRRDRKRLCELPTIQPEEHMEERTETHACDCISRQDAINACIRVREHHAYDEIEEIKALPSAEPRKKGEWVRNFDGNEWYWFCSNCKEKWYEEDLWMGGNDFPNFCPNCGADMREGEDE